MLEAAVALASAFNLMCSGTMYMRDPTDPYSGPTLQDVSETYRVDLAKQRWCVDKCTTTLPIARIGPTRITLQDLVTPAEGIQSYEVEVNRETGTMLSSLKLAGMEVRTVQHCEPQPFTGFPPLKF